MTGPARVHISSLPWRHGTYESLDRWRQGHILDGVPLVALASARVSRLWAEGQGIAASVAGVPILTSDLPTTHRAMVVSQGCELVKRTFPFATLAPVYEASQILASSQQDSARAGLTWHFVPLKPAWAVDGEFWVADLRLEIAVDKSILLESTPLEALPDEVSYAKLSERLAAIRSRPAVPQPTLDHVIRPLCEHLAQRVSEGASPLRGVREVRALSDHPINPSAVTLFVITEDNDEVDADEWAQAQAAVHAAAAEAGITLAGLEVTSIWDLSAADYITSQAIGDPASS